ncbi:aspartokinase [Elysia marginata]|uniref:Aspartokinase n=1 Tax=Elysia marginata TaxID=1093978 RepID=A0AAV4F1V2_9GAST|nr:aspartokinase [Elysia marginata]
MGVKNIVNILEENGYKSVLLVISAMGKMTNALEIVIDNYVEKDKGLVARVDAIKTFHISIIKDLFGESRHKAFEQVEALFQDLESFLETNTSNDRSYIYDQIICFGELLSTTIVSEYLREKGIKNNWVDAKTIIRTDSNFRDASVNWKQTETLIKKNINTSVLNITQGFIGSDSKGNATTLGREGSDFSAGIIASCLGAESVTIWKDVPGVLNADPRYFKKTKLLKEIPYEEAIELAFYGASIIHPKTLKPLKNKDIPLFVRSFLNPKEKGTSISNYRSIKPVLPCYILKKKQLLISLSTLDYSFIIEDNISEVFGLLHKYQFKVDMMQNSAISFSICIDNKFDNLEKLVESLEEKFKVVCYKNVNLYTIRHARGRNIKMIEKGQKVLLKQRLESTAQLIMMAD